MLGVERDEREDSFGDLDLCRAEIALSDNLDPYAHWGPAHPFHVGINRNHVAQVDRRDELHRLDRHGCDRTVRAARRDDARRDVHLAQNPAAEDMPVGIDVARAWDHTQHRRAFEIGHSWSISS